MKKTLVGFLRVMVTSVVLLGLFTEDTEPEETGPGKIIFYKPNDKSMATAIIKYIFTSRKVNEAINSVDSYEQIARNAD